MYIRIVRCTPILETLLTVKKYISESRISLAAQWLGLRALTAMARVQSLVRGPK